MFNNKRKTWKLKKKKNLCGKGHVGSNRHLRINLGLVFFEPVCFFRFRHAFFLVDGNRGKRKLKPTHETNNMPRRFPTSFGRNFLVFLEKVGSTAFQVGGNPIVTKPTTTRALWQRFLKNLGGHRVVSCKNIFRVVLCKKCQQE